MNIIIPIGGKGERFKKEGYNLPKPLIEVQNKKIIFYLLDSLNFQNNDKIFIIYNKELEEFNFQEIIQKSYPNYNIFFYKLEEQTIGVTESLLKGLSYFVTNNCIDDLPIVCIDSDCFYRIDILQQYRENSSADGYIFYTNIDHEKPVFSYIKFNEEKIITEIKEKERISDNINVGCYCFKSYNLLLQYCKKVLSDKSFFMNNEPYLSCVIKQMLNDKYIFEAGYINSENFVSLGTPIQVKEYENSIFAFLFDLDGTIVKTDNIYTEVWFTILQKYNIQLDKYLFDNYIQGHNDLFVKNTLLSHIDISVEDLSKLKDQLFLEKIEKIELMEGFIPFIQNIKKFNHKIGIVTNCNRVVVESIINKLNISSLIDVLIVGNELIKTKPHPDPYIEACKVLQIKTESCIIFEDSKTGLLSGKNVYPRALIALQNLYSKETYESLDVTLIINDYKDLNLKSLLELKNKEKMSLKDLIVENVERLFYREKIVDVKIDESKLKGGYISDVISLEIVTNLNNYQCVLKLENKNPSFLSKMANDLGLYEREYYFYENLSEFTPINIPKFYGLIKDQNNKDIGLLLENLFKQDFIPGINLNQVSIDNTLKIVESCAKLHVKFWNKDCQTLFPQLKKHNDNLFKPGWKNFLQEKWLIFKEKWNYLQNSNFFKIGDYVVKNFNIIQDYLSENNLTLCHGDIKSLNIFYKFINKGLYEPYFIDWQYIINGKGVQDITFFMIESFDVKIISNSANLIKDYYYTKCIENGVNNYSKEEYNKDFVYSIFYFPFFVAVWFGTLSTDDLIDKNFPYFFIQKLNNFINLFETDISRYLPLS